MALIVHSLMKTSKIMKYKIMLVIGLVIFLDNIGSGIIMPILPTLFMNNTIGIAYGLTLSLKNFYFGLSYLLFPLITIFSSPYLGYLSDFKGRKFIIVLGLFGFIVANLITIASILLHNLWLFLFTRVLLGFFAGSYTSANATLMDISSNEQEKISNIKFMTLLGILGFILSPIFSIFIPTKLTSTSLTIPFIIVFLLSIVSIFLVILFFPKLTSNENKQAKLPNVFKNFSNSIFFICKTRKILWLSITLFLFQLGYSFYFQIVALDLQKKHGFMIGQTAWFFFIMGICYTLGMYVFHSFLKRYFSNNIASGISLILSSIFIGILSINEMHIVFSNINNLQILWLCNILFFVVVPTASINISNQFIEITDENKGVIMGAIGQIYSLAVIGSSLLISIHTYFNNYELMVTSIVMFMVYLVHLVSYKKL